MRCVRRCTKKATADEVANRSLGIQIGGELEAQSPSTVLNHAFDFRDFALALAMGIRIGRQNITDVVSRSSTSSSFPNPSSYLTTNPKMASASTTTRYSLSDGAWWAFVEQATADANGASITSTITSATTSLDPAAVASVKATAVEWTSNEYTSTTTSVVTSTTDLAAAAPITSSMSSFTSTPPIAPPSIHPDQRLTTTPAAANTSTSISSKHDSGISEGALAGTAIACLLVGAALAAVVFFVLGRHRRRIHKGPNKSGVISDAGSSTNEEHKYVPLVPVGIQSSDRAANLTGTKHDAEATKPLPSASSVVINRKRLSTTSTGHFEKAVSRLRTLVHTLFEQLEMHVDNFYSDTPISRRLTSVQQDQLQKFDTPHLEDSVAGILPPAGHARSLIKHCLAQTIISGLDITSNTDHGHALLPSSMVALCGILSTTATEHQFLQWRSDTAALLGARTAASFVDTSDIAQGFSLAFAPWASDTYSLEARTSHLTKVIKEAIELGMDLLASPAHYEWKWQSGNASDRGRASSNFVVFPGLTMTARNGDTLAGHDQDPENDRIEVVPPLVAAL